MTHRRVLDVADVVQERLQLHQRLVHEQHGDERRERLLGEARDVLDERRRVSRHLQRASVVLPATRERGSRAHQYEQYERRPCVDPEAECQIVDFQATAHETSASTAQQCAGE